MKRSQKNSTDNMEFEAYQQESRVTALYPGAGENFIYPTLGLAGETGEIVEKIKKLIRNDNIMSAEDITEEKIEEIEKEMGDSLWYLAQLATELGIDLNTVAEKNIEKILSRKERNVLHGEGDDR